jgi:GTP-binding protein
MPQFVDEVDITVESGKGGAGAVSFRREKFVPKGGPDGGDGGRGGDVLLRVDPSLRTLYDLKTRRIVKARSGQPGRSRNQKGSDGEDAVIPVPRGTVAIDRESGETLGDLVEADDQLCVARGGKGGQGNARFATSVRQAPRFAQPGRPGEQRELNLQVKFIADVGLVGLPNAGKSTLLSVLTRARPKIGAYPFTTLVPNLGVMYYRREKEIVLADIPGLIEGASQGHGLGVRFLKHVERTRALLFLLDLYTGNLEDQYAMLLNELKLYGGRLRDKPRLVVGSRSDIAAPGSLEELGRLQPRWGQPESRTEALLSVSAVTGQGMGALKDRIGMLVEKTNAGTHS